MTSSRMRGRKTRSPMKRERDLNFRKGAGLVSVNERVRTQQTASSLSKGSRREHQPGRAPWTWGWHHPRIPDSTRGKQVLGLWHGGRSRREHTHLRGATHARVKPQPPPTPVSTSVPRSGVQERTLLRICFVCGSRWPESTSITPSASCVWAARWWSRTGTLTPWWSDPNFTGKTPAPVSLKLFAALAHTAA